MQAKKARRPFFIKHATWPYGKWHDYFRTLDVGDAIFAQRCTPPDTSQQDMNMPMSDYMQAVREIFVLRPHLTDRARPILQQMGEFISIFVRRGDKLIKEAQYIPMSDILKRIDYSDTTRFFIQTDDYTVVEEAQSILGAHRVFSTVPSTKRGSYHTDKHVDQETYNAYIQTVIPWNKKTPAQAKEETEEMLVGLYICLQARECWSDDTSNVGRFLKLYDDAKVHIYPENYCVNPNQSRIHPTWSIR